MALRFIDSFDGYASADILSKWSGYDRTPTIGSGGRTSNCVQLSYSLGAAGLLRKSLDNQATWIFGAAFKFSAAQSSDTIILAFLDGTNTQIDVRVKSGGALIVCVNGVTLATSTLTVNTSVYNYLEFKATINNTTGSYTLRVNGTTWLTASNVDTQFTANAYAQTIQLGHPSNAGVTMYFDDVYIFDSSGSTNNDFAGDVSVACQTVDSAGDLSDWTPSAGSNYQCVDDATPNGDTDYNASSTVGNRDLFNFTNLTGAVTGVLGIQRTIVARKDDAGTRTIKPLYKNGGTVYEGTAVSVADGYTFLTDIMETDPATGVAWVATGVNSAQFGVKLES